MSGRAHREMEWQFSADGLDATRAWIAQQPSDLSSRRFAPRAAVSLRDSYYDSADWLLFRAGFALRLRRLHDPRGNQNRELTLKSLTPARGGFASRREFSETVESEDLHAAMAERHGLAARLRALIGERPLQELFSARTHRERHLLLEAESDLPLAELDLDETVIESPDGKRHQLVRIELECLNAHPAVLAPLVEQLRASAHLIPAALSKFRAGLDVAGLSASLPSALPRREIAANQPFAQAQLAILGRYFEDLFNQEPAARLGSVGAVHDLRTAAHHLDTLVKAFSAHGPRWATRSRKAIRSLICALGRVRDCDVQIAWLDGQTASDSEAPLELEAIRERLQAERAEVHAALNTALDTPETQAWIAGWRRELAQPDAGASTGPTTATVARDLIRKLFRKLRKRGSRIDGASTAEDLHEVRIRAKRLRYVLEAFAGLYGRAGARYLAALAKLQDLSGAYHDANVRSERLGKMARDPTLPRVACFALGQLAARGAREAFDCRAGFDRAWRRVRRKRWRALAAALDAVVAGA